jgi:hypothetical protein
LSGLKARLYRCDDMSQPGSTEYISSGVRHLADHLGTKTSSDFEDPLPGMALDNPRLSDAKL